MIREVFQMQSTKWFKVSRRVYALMLVAGMLMPGILHAAIVSGETTQSTAGKQVGRYFLWTITGP